MPEFEFRPLHSSGRDVPRQRQSVRISSGSATSYLGCVWRVAATGRWYYFRGGNVRKDGDAAGYDSREDAAQAMLEAFLHQGRAWAERYANTANTLRLAAGVPALAVVEVEDGG